MTMKITFQADTKGFEQVSKVLEQQQKLLNENADAAERLAKAQAGISRGGAGTNQNENLNYFKQTAQSIKDVTGALQQLNQSQGGFQSFFNLFSGFRKELSEAASDQKTGVFSILNSQVEVLKKNMGASVLNIRSMKEEIEKLEHASKADPANTVLKAQLGDARGFLSVEQQQFSRDSYLHQQAKMIQIMQQPVGTTVASFLGYDQNADPSNAGLLDKIAGRGFSPAGMMRFAGYAGAAFYAGRRAANFMSYAGEEMEENFYRSRMSILDEANQGNVGKYFMEKNKIGAYGNFLSGDGFFQKAYNFTSLAGNVAKSLLVNQRNLNDDELRELKAGWAYRSEAPSVDLINRLSSTYKQNIMSPEIRKLTGEYGYGKARDLQIALETGNGISLEEAAPALTSAGRMGIGTSQAIKEAAPFLINASLMGISERSRLEAFRRGVSISNAGAGFTELQGFLGNIQNAGINVKSNFEMRQNIADYTAGLQAQYQNAPVSAAQAANIFAANLTQSAGGGADQLTRVNAAMETTQIAGQRMSTPMTAENMAINAKLMSYGLSTHTRFILAERIARGDDRAFDALAKMTGKDPDQLRAEFSGSFKQVQQMRNRLSGIDTPKVQAENAVLMEFGQGNIAAAQYTGSSFTAANAPGGFNAETGPIMVSKQAATKSQISLSDKKTPQREIEEEKLRLQNTLLTDFEKIAKDSGTSISGMLNGAFNAMVEEIQKNMTKITADVALKLKKRDEPLGDANVDALNKNASVGGSIKGTVDGRGKKP